MTEVASSYCIERLDEVGDVAYYCPGLHDAIGARRLTSDTSSRTFEIDGMRDWAFNHFANIGFSCNAAISMCRFRVRHPTRRAFGT